MISYDENGNLRNFEEDSHIVTCSKCHKKYYQETEEQVAGFRDVDYDICPYCKADNGSSAEVEYTNYKLEDIADL